MLDQPRLSALLIWLTQGRSRPLASAFPAFGMIRTRLDDVSREQIPSLRRRIAVAQGP